jgi:hypothetical protein
MSHPDLILKSQRLQPMVGLQQLHHFWHKQRFGLFAFVNFGLFL